MAESIKGMGTVLGVGIGIVEAIKQEEQSGILCPERTQAFSAAGSGQNPHPGVAVLSFRSLSIAVHMIRSHRMDKPGAGQQVLQFRSGFVGRPGDDEHILFCLFRIGKKGLMMSLPA